MTPLRAAALRCALRLRPLPLPTGPSLPVLALLALPLYSPLLLLAMGLALHR